MWLKLQSEIVQSQLRRKGHNQHFLVPIHDEPEGFGVAKLKLRDLITCENEAGGNFSVGRDNVAPDFNAIPDRREIERVIRPGRPCIEYRRLGLKEGDKFVVWRKFTYHPGRPCLPTRDSLVQTVCPTKSR